MSSPFERLWKDTMDVYGWVDYTEDDVTKSRLDVVKPNVKCHYSKGMLTETGEDGVPTLISSHLLFCSVSAGLNEGDEVIVTQQNGKIVKLKIGEGFPYSGDMQFRVKRSDTA